MNNTTSIIKTSAQVLVILMIMTCCRVNNKIDTYEQLIDSVNSLEEKELFHEAGELLMANKKLTATNSLSFKKELIYVNEKTENYTANLDIFREGHQEGKFFMINPRIPKFKPYLNLTDFNEIAQRDMFLRDSTNEVSTAQTQVLMPQNIREGRVYPTVFIFHGGGSNIDRARKNWTSEILDRNFIRIFVQSSLHYDSETYGWRNNDDKGLSDLKEIAPGILSEYPVDTSRIYVAGISAGGTFAVYSTIKQAIPIKGYFGVCTGIPMGIHPEEFEALKNISAYMITGTKDHYKPKQDSLSHIYSKLSIRYRYIIIEPMGHRYPKKFPEWLDQGMNFLLETDE